MHHAVEVSSYFCYLSFEVLSMVMLALIGAGAMQRGTSSYCTYCLVEVHRQPHVHAVPDELYTATGPTQLRYHPNHNK